MKKIYNIVGLLLTVLLGFQSCTKDFIELNPKTGQLEDNFYLTEDDAFAALTGVYDALSVQNWGNIYMSAECFSDDVFGGGGDYGDQEQLKEIDFDLVTLENTSAANIWNKSYSGIYRANLYLQKQDGINWETDGLKERIEAEVKFLRAYFYWDLARHFGWVPIITEVLPTVDEYKNLSQNTPDEVYTQIATDLLASINSNALPLSLTSGEFGRVTKYAAEALLARIYMYHEGFAKVVLPGVGDFTDGVTVVDKQYALNALEDVIINGPYNLIDTDDPAADIADVHAWGNQNNVESIFEIQYSGETISTNWDNYADGWIVDGNFFVQWIGPNSPDGDDNINGGWGLGVLSWSLVNEFEAGDPRYDVTVYDADALLNSYDKRFQNTGYFNNKYQARKEYKIEGGVAELNWAKNYVDIRLADVLLMAAELNIGVDDAKALDYFNRVRERAMGNGSGLISTPALADIQHERRVELACEGLRKWDMLRWGLDYTKAAIDKSFADATGKTNSQDFIKFKGFDKQTYGMLPIPASEIRNTNSGVLKQYIPAYQ